MTGKKFLRVQRGERIDQPDFDHLSYISQRDLAGQIIDKLLVGDDKTNDPNPTPRTFVLKGFAVTVDGGGNVTVNGGTAIMGFRDRGVIGYGALITEGDASKVININSYANSATARGVFVRAVFREDTYSDRPFWNPLASPNPTEFIRSVPTRLSENWEVAIEFTAPGVEWMRIADVVKNPGLTPTDRRNFFFEGQAANTFLAVDAEWGLASPPFENDRSNTRDTAGVFGFYRWARAMERQIQDIIGAGIGPITTVAGWWRTLGGTVGDTARNLTQLFNEKLARDGSQLMNGNITPGANNVYSVGLDGGDQWHNMGCFQLQVGQVDSNLNPNVDNGWTVGTGAFRWLEGHFVRLFANDVRSDLTPNVNVTRNLGAAAFRWLVGYFSTVDVGDQLNMNIGSTTLSPINLRIDDGNAAHRGQIAQDGTGKIFVTAGVAGSIGASAIQLNGTSVQLSHLCGGQNGVVYAQHAWTLLDPGIPQDSAGTNYGVNYLTLVFTPAAGSTSFNVGDTILALMPDANHANTLFNVHTIIGANAEITGLNTIAIPFFNHTPGGALSLVPPGDILFAVILRR